MMFLDASNNSSRNEGLSLSLMIVKDSGASRSGPIRILIGKVGLDGHDRGAKVVMMALRDAGMEVIYSGLHQTPEALVRAAIEEDVDLIGISILSGSHNTLIPKMMKKLKSEGAAQIGVYVGGIIPPQDFSKLKKAGVRQIFTPGTPLEDIIRWARQDVAKIRKGATKKS